MTRLQQLHDRYGQSPWLDNLTRGDVTGGRLIGRTGGRRGASSPMGRIYRETTPAMVARVTAAPLLMARGWHGRGANDDARAWRDIPARPEGEADPRCHCLVGKSPEGSRQVGTRPANLSKTSRRVSRASIVVRLSRATASQGAAGRPAA
jgi:hypothetical protein